MILVKNKGSHKVIGKGLFILLFAVFAVLSVFILSLYGMKAARLKKITAAAQNSSVINGDYKYYSPFTARNMEVRLLPEPVMTADDAVKLYPNAYEFCADLAQKTGITVSMDNPEFVEFAKIHLSFNESGSEDFVTECKDFGIYLDYYEDIAINKKILEELSSNTLWLNKDSVEAMMRISANPTMRDN